MAERGSTFAPHVMQVIEAEVIRGKGIDESDPLRRVRQYFTLTGELLAEYDPCLEALGVNAGVTKNER